jgi:hypothetical protein
MHGGDEHASAKVHYPFQFQPRKRPRRTTRPGRARSSITYPYVADSAAPPTTESRRYARAHRISSAAGLAGCEIVLWNLDSVVVARKVGVICRVAERE